MPDPADTLEYSDCIIKRSDGEVDARPLYDDMRMADMLECIGLGQISFISRYIKNDWF